MTRLRLIPGLPVLTQRAILAAFAVMGCLSFGSAAAEPYLAVQAGLKCVNCHINPSGGGKRNVFGTIYARTQISERTLTGETPSPPWTGEIYSWLGFGGDYRGGYSSSDVPGSDDTSDWLTEKATVYLEIEAVPGLLTIYGDQQLAPGDSLNREGYVMLTPGNGRYTIKAGQFFLPFGLRLQDDNAFVRQRSGISMTTPDEGIELGLELPRWSAQVAVTDGTAGAGSAPGKEQTSLSAVHVRPRWRVGASYNLSEDPLGDREMQALFAGWRTGPISWLAELDFIQDDVSGGGTVETYATLIEGNWRFKKGHNLKIGYEFLDPSDGVLEDEEERYSVVWEYSPFQLFQARVGYRFYNGVPLFPATNRTDFFFELHGYF